jgi:hypothetical protein
VWTSSEPSGERHGIAIIAKALCSRPTIARVFVSKILLLLVFAREFQ